MLRWTEYKTVNVMWEVEMYEVCAELLSYSGHICGFEIVKEKAKNTQIQTKNNLSGISLVLNQNSPEDDGSTS